MCWKSTTTAERSTLRNWSESDLDTCTISWIFFSTEGLKLPDSFRYQLKYDPFMASNRRDKSPYGKYESKEEKETKLVPTTQCYGP